MKQGVRKVPHEDQRTSPALWLMRLGLLFLVAAACLALSILGYTRWLGSARADAPWLGGSEDLNPVRRLYLETYLAARADELSEPVGEGAGRVGFVVEPGQSAGAIAQDLSQAGLLHDTTLFINYLRYHGLDSQLEAGSYRIDPQWSIPEVALALTQSFGQEVALRFLEGWRLEEMATYLSTVAAAQIDGASFLNIARRHTPIDLSAYPVVASTLPAEASLEGFLFPDTYQLPLDADATVLVDQMLRNFEQWVTLDMRNAIEQNGLSLYEGVTLASIVEREAPLTTERPRVATVFYNRLAQGMPLQADPTVQYAVGFDEGTQTWWKSGLTRADLRLPSLYNTYVHSGLPPGPIANPGLSALEAVAYPMPGNDLFFVADCDNEGAHLFSQTYEQHLANVERCRQE